ncbi:45990_t:CDS:2, partial [Gigaspora margarita]
MKYTQSMMNTKTGKRLEVFEESRPTLALRNIDQQRHTRRLTKNTPNKRNSKTQYEEKIRKPGSWKQSNQPHTTVIVRGVDNELPGQNLERCKRTILWKKENGITTKTKRKKRERKTLRKPITTIRNEDST